MSDRLPFKLWLQAEYEMDENEYKRLPKEEKGAIRNEYNQYLTEED